VTTAATSVPAPSELILFRSTSCKLNLS
jgi:hypothetical protein